MKMIRFSPIIIISFILAACGTSPTDILPATEEIIPIGTTIVPTATMLSPTDTRIIIPNTPAPTYTLAATPTPLGGGNGKIAFTSKFRIAGDLEYIFLMDINNRVVKKLFDFSGEFGSLSPDGERITYVAHVGGDQDIYVININGHEKIRLTNDFAKDLMPTWSPDGEKIAFVKELPSSFEIYVIDADGKNLHRLTNNSRGDYGPSWSPDSKKIVYSGDGIRVMASDGSNSGLITEGDYPSWSPDGEKISYCLKNDSNQNRELYISDPNGENPVLLYAGESVGHPAWSPDGNWIVFNCRIGEGVGLCLMDIETKEVRELTDSKSWNYNASWYPAVKSTDQAPSSQVTKGIDLQMTPTTDLQQSGLINEWGGVVTYAWMLNGICQRTFINNTDLQYGGIDQSYAESDLAEKIDLLAQAQSSLRNYQYPTTRVKPFYQELTTLGKDLDRIMEEMSSGKLGTQSITTQLDEICSKISIEGDRVQWAAVDAGLIGDSLVELETSIKEILCEINN